MNGKTLNSFKKQTGSRAKNRLRKILKKLSLFWLTRPQTDSIINIVNKESETMNTQTLHNDICIWCYEPPGGIL